MLSESRSFSKGLKGLFVLSTLALGTIAFGQAEPRPRAKKSAPVVQAEGKRGNKLTAFALTIYPRLENANPRAGLPIAIVGDAAFNEAMAWTQKNVAVSVKKTGTMGPILNAPYRATSIGTGNTPGIFAHAPALSYRSGRRGSRREQYEGGISSITVTVTITNIDENSSQYGESRTGTGTLPVVFGDL